jgi:hypothetical protein
MKLLFGDLQKNQLKKLKEKIMIKIDESTEEFKKIKKDWEKEATEQTLDTIPEFINKLMNNYEHDYGTIIHATWAAMSGTFYACDNSEQGGFSGFQAGFLGWKAVRKFLYDDEVGMKLLGYKDLIYPQQEYVFTTIPKSIFEKAQEVAKKEIEENGHTMHKEVKDHMEKIIAGKAPFGLKISETE